MAEQTTRERLSGTIFALLGETFEQVRGIYLDRGTSLLETLDTITAEEASRPVGGRCATLAAQVEHVTFYLQVMRDYIRQEPMGEIDWQATWRRQGVTAEEWQALRQELREEYGRVTALLRSCETWEGENEIGGALATIVHTAYHLGEIRQALCTLKT
ncbi:MAG TPA: DinB family protein [Roseiflexaceae bacterium]|nr:DinB family protein [Roseiflexaceae bacterium]